MKWRVEILGSKGGDRLLKDVLRKLSIDVVEEDGTNFLVSERFEALDKYTEVHELASRVGETIEEVSKYDDELTLGLQLGSVIEEREDGSRRNHYFVTPLNAAVAVSMTMVPSVSVLSRQALSEEELKQIEEERKEGEYQQLSRRAISRLVSAFTDSKALQVQRLLNGDLTPQTLGHLADLIQDDLGNGIASLASSNQWSRFFRSINHPAVFGEQARHIVSSEEPPPNPMRLSEAQHFIRQVANAWLERKAGLGSAENS
jgi:hypothetical protein